MGANSPYGGCNTGSAFDFERLQKEKLERMAKREQVRIYIYICACGMEPCYLALCIALYTFVFFLSIFFF